MMEEDKDNQDKEITGAPAEEGLGDETTGAPAENDTSPKTAAAAEGKQAEKHEKFRQLSEPRMQKAEKALDLLSNLTGPNYYYTEAEANTMMTHLQSCLDKLKEKFQKTKSSSEEFHW